MKYISTLLVALSLTATAAHAGTSVEVGSGKNNASNEDFYSVRFKNQLPVGGGFSVIPELRLDNGKDSGKTTGNAKLGVYHDVLKVGPAIVGTRVNLVETFGAPGRNTGWSVEPNLAVTAGNYTLGASYEYGEAFDKGVAADVKTTKLSVVTPISKKTDLSIKHEVMRGDSDKNTTFVGVVFRF